MADFSFDLPEYRSQLFAWKKNGNVKKKHLGDEYRWKGYVLNNDARREAFAIDMFVVWMTRNKKWVSLTTIEAVFDAVDPDDTRYAIIISKKRRRKTTRELFSVVLLKSMTLPSESAYSCFIDVMKSILCHLENANNCAKEARYIHGNLFMENIKVVLLDNGISYDRCVQDKGAVSMNNRIMIFDNKDNSITAKFDEGFQVKVEKSKTDDLQDLALSIIFTMAGQLLPEGMKISRKIEPQSFVDESIANLKRSLELYNTSEEDELKYAGGVTAKVGEKYYGTIADKISIKKIDFFRFVFPNERSDIYTILDMMLAWVPAILEDELTLDEWKAIFEHLSKKSNLVRQMLVDFRDNGIDDPIDWHFSHETTHHFRAVYRLKNYIALIRYIMENFMLYGTKFLVLVVRKIKWERKGTNFSIEFEEDFHLMVHALFTQVIRARLQAPKEHISSVLDTVIKAAYTDI